MNIKYMPQGNTDKPALTNVGEFRPGQVLSMQPHQEKEARRLIDNGDFVEVEDAPDTTTSAVAAPEVAEAAETLEENVEEEIADAPKSRAKK